MKRIFAAALVLLFLLFGGAYAAGCMVKAASSQEAQPAAAPAESVVQAAYLHDTETVLRVKQGNDITEMNLYEYLCGVVRGEMLPSFTEAALCAQAAAERTYVYYQLEKGAKSAHPDADICTDPGCCNAFMSEETAQKKWGSSFAECNGAVEKAVQETDGQVALYEGEPILAVFHSSCAGSTAASGEVWTADLPYLVSVESPEEGTEIPNYYSVNTYTAAEFQRIILSAHPEASFSGEAKGWVRDIVTNDERVDSAVVGGVTITGKELRSLFGLRSTAFTLSWENDAVTFHVTGYGHGVGMSQYGANELGRQGKTWQEILQWYYTGVTVDYYQTKNEE